MGKSTDCYADRGADGHALPDAFMRTKQRLGSAKLALEIMRQVWVQQFYRSEEDIHWRTEMEGVPPSALFIASPYDPEAHFAKKRSTSWVGYKVHLTESCEEDQPHLITHVETTGAPVAHSDVLETIHDALAADDLLPAVHLTDTGYVDAKRLLSSRTQYNPDLLGPTRGDYHRRGRENKGFAAQDGTIGWERHQDLPGQASSANWVPDAGSQGPVHPSTSPVRPARPALTASTVSTPRCPVDIDPAEAGASDCAMQTIRHREKTAEFREQYGKRAGIEGDLVSFPGGEGVDGCVKLP